MKTILISTVAFIIGGVSGIPKFLIRYADDWVLMTASQKEAERLLKLLRKYFKYKLKVELSDEKTVITNLEENHVDFLGYRLLMEKLRDSNGKLTDKRFIRTPKEFKSKYDS